MSDQKMKILLAMVDDEKSATFLTEENMRTLESLGTVIWDRTVEKITPEWLRENLVDIDVCVCCWGVPCFDAYVLEKANKLKLIGYCAGSVAHVVSDEMYERGIRIVCGNEMFAQSVAECTVAYMLAAQRDLRKYNNIINGGGWKELIFTSRALLEKNVGVVGYGAISRYLLEMLKPFHVNIKLYSKHMSEEQAAELGVRKASLEEIFSTCDIVSLHCAKTPENHHLINDTLLSMMKDDALLVNTARGDVVDEEALAKHLHSGHIRAALDVYQQEPPAMDNPLRGTDNIYMFPHIGGPTIDRRPACARVVFEDIARLQKGEELRNEIKAWRSKMMTH